MFSFLSKVMIGAFLLVFLVISTFSQTAMIDNISQEVSEEDNIPVLVKHLPDWEKAKDSSILVANLPAFTAAVDDHPIAQVITFTPGTEAVTAKYDAGKLAIVEFTSPQFATDGDAKIQAKLIELAGQNVPIYRRVGNYAVFVFNPKDEAAANTLIDQIKYEKVVTWMGSNPNVQRKYERNYIETTSDVVLGAIQITGYIILITATLGGLAGFFIFRLRNRQRLQADSYTDAGGMTRLNLDDFSTSSSPDRFLNK